MFIRFEERKNSYYLIDSEFEEWFWEIDKNYMVPSVEDVIRYITNTYISKNVSYIPEVVRYIRYRADGELSKKFILSEIEKHFPDLYRSLQEKYLMLLE